MLPSGQALEEIFALSLASAKMIDVQYWDRDAVLEYAGADVVRGEKRLVMLNEEYYYSSRLQSFYKSKDGSAFVCESINSIYLVPLTIKARRIQPVVIRRRLGDNQ
jgi:hypothetical protein